MVLHTELYLDSSDDEKNLDGVMLITCCGLAIMKVVYFYVWRSGLTTNFTSALVDYKNLRNEEERAIVRWHAFMGRVACASVILTAYVSSTFFMLVASLVKTEEGVNVTEKGIPAYPVPCEYTLEIINLPKDLAVVVFVVEYLMLIVVSNGNLGNDFVLVNEKYRYSYVE